VFQCKDMVIKDVTVTAPGDSPNTDGIHMGDSSGVTISNTVIGVGDDCISIGPGSTKVNITGVTCGPGHGISIGSLGRYKDEKDVTDINVKDCTFKKSTNGLRIKAYEDAKSVLTASKIHYENIKMEDAANPIIIDMKYCPNKICTASGGSKVTVKDVSFKNITGTSSTPDMSEAYYVMSGEGSVTVNGETVAIKKGDAIPVDIGQSKSFKAGAAPLELMIIGVAKDMAAKNAFAAIPANENPDLLLARLNRTR